MGASDRELAEELRQIGSALVCDALDSMGVRTSFLGPGIRPLWNSEPFAGRALTLACLPSDEVDEEPYGVLFRALAEPRPDTVLVIAAGDHHSGVWGELLSVAARARGVVGVVTDGLVRDRTAIVELGFPVHAAGLSPLDSAGRQDFAELGGTVHFGDVAIRSGDWVIADELGAVAIPVAVAQETIQLASEKNRGERTVRRELEQGEDLGSVFRRHGIL